MRLNAIARLLYAALDGELVDDNGNVVDVRDHVDVDEPLPFVAIGAMSASPRDPDAKVGTCGATVLAEVAVFSRVAGFREAHDIAEQVHQLLEGASTAELGVGVTSFFESFDSGEEEFSESDIVRVGRYRRRFILR